MLKADTKIAGNYKKIQKKPAIFPLYKKVTACTYQQSTGFNDKSGTLFLLLSSKFQGDDPIFNLNFSVRK